MTDDGLPLTWGLALLAAGLLLCFTGTRSVRLAAACAGFGTGSVLADALGGGIVAVLLVGAAGAAAALALVGVVVRAGFFVVGAAAAAAIAASAVRATAPAGWNPLLAVLVVAAAGLLGGVVVVRRARRPVLAVLTALGGSAIALRGVVAIVPALGFLREPTTAAGGAAATAAWLGLAVCGWVVQRRARGRREGDRRTPAPSG